MSEPNDRVLAMLRIAGTYLSSAEQNLRTAQLGTVSERAAAEVAAARGALNQAAEHARLALDLALAAPEPTA